MPIIATITPGTLTIRSIMTTNSITVVVPYPNYTINVGFTANAWYSVDQDGYLSGVSPPLNHALYATSTSPSILPLSAPFPNSTYTLAFNGPALKCQNLSTAASDPTVVAGIIDSTAALNFTSVQQAFESYVSLPSAYYYQDFAPGSFKNYIFINAGGTNGTNLVCNL